MKKLTLTSVSKQFGEADIFSEISCEFKQGVSYGIVGVSGCGKSTLISLLAGLDQPSHGTICFNGVSVLDFAQRKPSDFYSEIGVVFQSPYLIRELTVLENIILKGLTSGKSRSECEQWGKELLDAIGLIHKATASPATLSGGEQQRVSIVRALYSKPAFLLADEPTAHLDSENLKRVLALFNDFKTAHNIGFIVSSHDPEAWGAMDEQLYFSQGTLKQKNSTDAGVNVFETALSIRGSR